LATLKFSFLRFDLKIIDQNRKPLIFLLLKSKKDKNDESDVGAEMAGYGT
jgi:hypothetical protein